MADSLSPILTGASAASPRSEREDPKKLKDSALQFEAILIAQMMRSMRESGSGWMGTGDDSASASAIEMAEEQFAQAMASQGGLGLAAMVTRGLRKEEGGS